MPATTVIKVQEVVDTTAWRFSDLPASVRLPRRFVVTLNQPDVANGRTLARTASDGSTSIPAMGATLAGTSYYVREIEAAFKARSATQLDVVAWYAAADQSGDGDNEIPPWERQAEIDINTNPEPVEYEWDFNGKIFGNTAGCPYANAITLPLPRSVITYRFAKLRSGYDPFYARQFCGSFNEAALTFDDGYNQGTFAAKTLQLSAVRTRNRYWPVTGQKYYDIEVVAVEMPTRYAGTTPVPSNELWIPSMGTSQLRTGGSPGVAADLRPIYETVDGLRVAVTTPRYLNEDGQQTTPDAAAIDKYVVGTLADWSGVLP